MTRTEFEQSLEGNAPPEDCTAMVAALWWDARGDWARAHELVDELESPDGMAVHAYLHRKEGVPLNAEYWYRRAGKGFQRESLEEEWQALVQHFLPE